MKKIKKWIAIIKRKRELNNMDILWHMLGQGSYDWGYPPSFYATHTQEEIDTILKKDKEEIMQLLKQMD